MGQIWGGQIWEKILKWAWRGGTPELPEVQNSSTSLKASLKAYSQPPTAVGVGSVFCSSRRAPASWGVLKPPCRGLDYSCGRRVGGTPLSPLSTVRSSDAYSWSLNHPDHHAESFVLSQET